MKTFSEEPNKYGKSYRQVRPMNRFQGKPPTRQLKPNPGRISQPQQTGNRFNKGFNNEPVNRFRAPTALIQQQNLRTQHISYQQYGSTTIRTGANAMMMSPYYMPNDRSFLQIPPPSQHFNQIRSLLPNSYAKPSSYAPIPYVPSPIQMARFYQPPGNFSSYEHPRPNIRRQQPNNDYIISQQRSVYVPPPVIVREEKRQSSTDREQQKYDFSSLCSLPEINWNEIKLPPLVKMCYNETESVIVKSLSLIM
jgi:hypothetical protein